MTIFISDSTPQQPAFLFANYPSAATATATGTAAGYYAADVLQADENNGWKPLHTFPTGLIVDFGTAVLNDYLALVGCNLAGVSIALQGSDNNLDFTSLSPEVQMTGTDAVWLRYSPAAFRYFRLIISGQSSAFQIKHLVIGLLAPLPFLEDGSCSNPMQSDGQHLISHAGLFLGSVTNKVIRPFSLSFGQVTAVEEVSFSTWAEACIRTAQAFFFVPDTSQDICHFGYVDKNWKYEPVMKIGMATIPNIPFTARAI